MFSPCNPRPVGRKVYIGELGNNGSVQELGNAFSLFGPLTNVWVARNPPGFAFVEFEDSRHAEEAIRALNGTILCGRRVRVEFARNSRSSYRPPPRNDSLEVCYTCGEVGHYARDCIVEQLDWLQMGDESDSNNESDDETPYSYDHSISDMERIMIQPRNYYHAYYHDGRNSNSYQHRSNRPQEQQRNLALNIRPQDEHRNVAWRSRRRLLTRPQENHSNVASEIRRNNRPEEEHRNATSQEQSNSVNNLSSPETASAILTSNLPNDASGDVKCVICLDTVEDRMEYITCGHGFHAKCCNDWLSVNGACPVCRTRVSPGNGFVLEGFEGSFFQQMGYSYHIESVPGEGPTVLVLHS